MHIGLVACNYKPLWKKWPSNPLYHLCEYLQKRPCMESSKTFYFCQAQNGHLCLYSGCPPPIKSRKNTNYLHAVQNCLEKTSKASSVVQGFFLNTATQNLSFLNPGHMALSATCCRLRPTHLFLCEILLRSQQVGSDEALSGSELSHEAIEAKVGNKRLPVRVC